MIRELASCRPVNYKGSQLQFPWAHTSSLEVWVAAYGPLALKAAGEVGDGYILQLADVDIAALDDHHVREAAADAGVTRTRSPSAWPPELRRRRLGAHARPVPLVRRHGRQPRGRHRRPVRRERDVPAALTDYIKGRQGTTTTSTVRPATPTPPSCPTKSSTASASWGRPRTTSPSSSSSGHRVDQFAGYLQHDNKEETLRVYGETIIPSMREHVAAKA